MNNAIMISGPHAIGKTTTAKSLAYELGYCNVGSVAGFVAEKMKYEFEKATAIEVAEYQYEVSKAFEFIYEATATSNTICDRSPLDLAVYLTLQLRDKPELNHVVDTYQQLCLEITKRYCHALVLPAADLEEHYDTKLGRPPFSKEQITYRQDYVELLDALVEQLPNTIKVIRVPVDKQYGQRVNYILARLRFGEVE